MFNKNLFYFICLKIIQQVLISKILAHIEM